MKKISVAIAALVATQMAFAQIPVEVVGGDKRASFDLMFFKFFKNNSGQNSKFLFFSRERAVVQYKQANNTILPQFGFTEAVSYNHPALKGFAPVLVGQILNSGTFAKTGLQYARVSKNTTLFGWSVVELRHKPGIDVFLLLRHTPKLTETLSFYTQVEILNTFPTSGTKFFSFTQRLRLGLKIKDWQFGAAADFSQSGSNQFSKTAHSGLFLRHEF